jgi:hypothetical protein
MTDGVNGISNLAATPAMGARFGRNASASFFEALAEAWGQTLDGQAQKIQDMSNIVSAGGDKPSQISELTAESMRMTFLSQSSSTSIDSVGKALETMARKG